MGYCTHGSILFPTWHRPYLALFEVRRCALKYRKCMLTKYSKYFGAMLKILLRLIRTHSAQGIKLQPRHYDCHIGTGLSIPQCLILSISP